MPTHIIFNNPEPGMTDKKFNTIPDILFLDNETSILLPYFDTSSIINSNIDSIVLSLYVIDKTPETSQSVHLTINPVDQDTGQEDEGLSTNIDVKKDEYLHFELPKELFRKTVGTQKRLAVRLISKGVKLALQGPGANGGTTQDPRLTVVHGKIKNTETPDQPRLIQNNYINMHNPQFHSGSGDNVGRDQIQKPKKESFWSSLAVQVIGGLLVLAIASIIVWFISQFKVTG